MTNSKLVGAGVLIVVGLVVITAGSMALPLLSRGDSYTYKVVERCDWNFHPFEDQLNQTAKDGWEFIAGIGANNCHLVFRKK
ncbi:MAG TPA: hypothetical protein VI981_03145 [Candidatus Paceibacterota bacterium]